MELRELGRERLFRFPDFWDYDWFYYNAIEQAEDEGKHMVVLKARARGYSFKGASMLCRNYFLIPKSKEFCCCIGTKVSNR